MKHKQTGFVWIFAFLLVVLGLLNLFFGKTGHSSSAVPSGVFRGFDVDGDKNIYIGTEKQIYVYQNGVLSRVISPPTSRAYCFYIENELLYMGCASDNKGGIYDLEGEEIAYGEIKYSEVKSRANGKLAVRNGDEYRIRQNLTGAYTVTCNGELVLQTESSFYESIWYWLCVIGLLLAFVVLFFSLVVKTRKSK
jgi:hypothetical protein